MNKKKIIILIVAAAVVIGGAAYFFLLRNNDGENQPLYEYAMSDAFVTNVKDSSKLFKTSVILVVDKKGMDDFFDENEYTIRDTILFMLRDLTEEDISSSDIQAKLRVSIPQALNSALGIDNIVSVYFSDFVMQ